MSLLAIIAIGTALRTYGLGAKALWFDEAVTASYLDFTPLEILRRCAEPKAVHPPLYFVMVRCWAAVAGDSEVALRGLSVLFGLATIAGVYLLTRELGQLARPQQPALADRAAPLTALLVALSPMQVELSRTARGYTLTEACLTLGGWALLRALRGGRRSAAWAAAAIFAAAACYSHHVAILTVFAQGLFAAAFIARRWKPASGGIGDDRPDLRGAALGLIIFVSIYIIPWLPKLLPQSETVRHGAPWRISLQRALDQSLDAVYASYDVRWDVEPMSRWLVVALSLGLFSYLMYRGGWHRWYLLATGLLPPAIMVAYSLRSDHSIFHARYLCFAQLSWLGAVAITAAEIPARAIRVLVTSQLVVVSAYACYDNWSLIDATAQPGMRAATRFIVAHRKPGELVVAQTPYVFFGVKYYGRGSACPLLCVRVSRRQEQYGSEQLNDEELITPEQLASADPPGVWMVSADSYNTSLIVEPAIPDRWVRDGSWSFDQDRWLERPVRIVHYRLEQDATRAQRRPD